MSVRSWMPWRDAARAGFEYCAKCAAFKRKDDFHPSSLRRELRQCRACVCARVRRQARASTVRLENKLLRNLRRWARRHDRPASEQAYLSSLRPHQNVSAIVRRWGRGQATARGAGSAKGSGALVLLPWRPEEPFDAHSNYAVFQAHTIYGEAAVERAERIPARHDELY